MRLRLLLVDVPKIQRMRDPFAVFETPQATFPDSLRRNRPFEVACSNKIFDFAGVDIAVVDIAVVDIAAVNNAHEGALAHHTHTIAVARARDRFEASHFPSLG
jgi:hypothetical protein